MRQGNLLKSTNKLFSPRAAFEDEQLAVFNLMKWRGGL